MDIQLVIVDPSGNNMSNLNYLSVVDYANGGAAAKIYSLNEYIDYLDRNRTMMDSTENASCAKWQSINTHQPTIV